MKKCHYRNNRVLESGSISKVFNLSCTIFYAMLLYSSAVESLMLCVLAYHFNEYIYHMSYNFLEPVLCPPPSHNSKQYLQLWACVIYMTLNYRIYLKLKQVLTARVLLDQQTDSGCHEITCCVKKLITVLRRKYYIYTYLPLIEI